jgi:hypothetical protein
MAFIDTQLGSQAPIVVAYLADEAPDDTVGA